MILEAATIDKYFKNEDKRHYTFIYSEYSAEYGLASLRGDDEPIKCNLWIILPLMMS